jgi:hypothetical protein
VNAQDCPFQMKTPLCFFSQIRLLSQAVVLTNLLPSARHAVLTTLCSLACRVVLVRLSFVLRGLFESAFPEFLDVSIVRLLA